MNMHLFVILLIFFCMVEVAFGQTSKAPSKRPSIKPSKKPTVAPTSQPTGHPTSHPTSRPTSRPTSKQTPLKPVISSNSISPSSSGNIKTPSVALTSTNIPTKAPSISYYPTGPSLAPTPIEQHPGWFTAHYSAGHVAGAIIGSLTAAIACLLCAYNGRNKRAIKRDMKAFFGVTVADVDDVRVSSSNYNVPKRSKGQGQTTNEHQLSDDVYNPMMRI